MFPVFWPILSREVYFYHYHAPLLENHRNLSATEVYTKENVGVDLSRYRFGSDQVALQQWEPGYFCIRDDGYSPGAAGLDVGDKHPHPHHRRVGGVLIILHAIVI